MRYLLTNDDGIYARGLAALWAELSKDADCLIVAPEVEQSAVGHAITIARPLMVRAARKNGRFLGYAVAGTPADCVKIGIRELADGPVDLVVSGINRGANVGINVIYSGTVSAATESAILGVPSLAVSLDSYGEADYSVAARFARKMARLIVKDPLPGVAVNMNVPALPREEIRGVVVVRQGRARLLESFERRVDPRDNIYYWLAGETQLADGDGEDSDAVALKKGFVTVTPLHCDLTRHDLLGELALRIAQAGGKGTPTW
ncbi:MAG TPA: 5'/3'-nucleotidase SurE [Syntrophales bacterium]|nr:5'/3'-nucleotidase SurE [Syntrophales bacterium]HOM07041.1 5'/3'-nucleotidase SurE [Syntrophales bacterium]HON99560.1 5'/3'-nucleotidase SurE [Syntrophales bacterium]HPC01052.1 5'/3'-nucleotidase SurE [Syntrophales bacterium]HPQ06809.1 5'/3'-nucleotidase SurE [Syntrophales bacterium]